MTFTDEDLKRLKEWAGAVKGDLVFDELPSGKLLALLARLQAAEKKGHVIDDLMSRGLIISHPDLMSADTAWRKACGRE